MIIILPHYFWSLNKWEAHMQTVVIPTPFTWFGCKYPQIKADSLQLKHILFVSFPLWWCIEPKMLELCRCPNIYGPDCKWIKTIFKAWAPKYPVTHAQSSYCKLNKSQIIVLMYSVWLKPGLKQIILV